MKKALIITVGTGPETENGIFTSLRLNNPTLVAFLVSKESMQTLQRRPENAGGKTIRDLCENKIIELPTAEDIDEVFQKCEEVYHQLRHDGFLPSEVAVDITFGTKVMTAALTALSGIFGLDMTYVSGTREGATVKTGTERPIVMKPGRIMRRHQLENMKDYFGRYQFYACLELAKRELERAKLFSTTKVTSELQIASALVDFIEGFVHWELFDHKKAVSHFCKLGSAITQRDFLEELLSDKTKTASIHKDAKGNIPSRYLIIDLFCNAERRAIENDFDDAVARLYRCIEMVIQYSLAEKHRIYSDNIDFEILRNKVSAVTFGRLSKKERRNGKIQLGLMELLALLTDISPENPLCSPDLLEELNKCLGFRNYSILAHGVKPVGREDYEKMRNLTEKFIQGITTTDMLNDVSIQIKQCFEVKNLEPFIS